MGRGLGIYDAPRQVLEFLNGVELVQMKRNRQSAFYCGARTLGTYFDRAATVSAEERLEEFFATRADVLVTACPCCKQHFRSVLPPDRRHMVKDLVEIVAAGVT